MKTHYLWRATRADDSVNPLVTLTVHLMTLSLQISCFQENLWLDLMYSSPSMICTAFLDLPSPLMHRNIDKETACALRVLISDFPDGYPSSSTANTWVRTDDDSNVVDIAGDPPTRARTTWTLLIYLTSPATGCQGGETVFYPEAEPTKVGRKQSKSNLAQPIVVGLEVGMALLHKHGKDCLLHEGKMVSQGEKWVIRSDICIKR